MQGPPMNNLRKIKEIVRETYEHQNVDISHFEHKDD